MTGSIPDLNIATQIATPTTTEAGRRHPTGREAERDSTANSPIAMSSAGIDTCFVYAVAITSSAPRSSNTASVSRNTRRRVAELRRQQRQRAERERRVGRHRRAPAVGARHRRR